MKLKILAIILCYASITNIYAAAPEPACLKYDFLLCLRLHQALPLQKKAPFKSPQDVMMVDQKFTDYLRNFFAKAHPVSLQHMHIAPSSPVPPLSPLNVRSMSPLTLPEPALPLQQHQRTPTPPSV